MEEWLKKSYEELPLSEIDETDPDFSTIVETRDLLPQLLSSIDIFLSNPTREGWNQVDSVVQQMIESDRPKYEERIKSLHQRLQTEPAP